jgi:hypothetical protein
MPEDAPEIRVRQPSLISLLPAGCRPGHARPPIAVPMAVDNLAAPTRPRRRLSPTGTTATPPQDRGSHGPGGTRSRATANTSSETEPSAPAATVGGHRAEQGEAARRPGDGARGGAGQGSAPSPPTDHRPRQGGHGRPRRRRGLGRAHRLLGVNDLAGVKGAEERTVRLCDRSDIGCPAHDVLLKPDACRSCRFLAGEA